MKRGIYLGPPVGRMHGVVKLLVLLGVIGTLLHGTLYLLELRELAELRADVTAREASAAARPSSLGDDERQVLARLRAIAVSGAATATSIAPTDLMQLMSGALPDDVALVSFSFEPSSSPPSLLVEAVARRERDVSELERRVAASPNVAATTLLGEKRAADGTFSIRLQVELSP